MRQQEILMTRMPFWAQTEESGGEEPPEPKPGPKGEGSVRWMSNGTPPDSDPDPKEDEGGGGGSGYLN